MVSQSTDILVSMILHMYSNIHTFLLAYLALGLGVSLRISAKSWFYIVEIAGGWRGGRVCHMRYCECYLRVSLWRHPRTKY